MPSSGKTTRTIVWALAGLFVATLTAVTALFVLVPDTDGVTAFVGTILANLSALVAVIVNLQRTGEVQAQVSQVAQDTTDLRNGLLDAKIRAGVTEVIHPDLVHPEYTDATNAVDMSRREDAATDAYARENGRDRRLDGPA